MKPTMTDKEIWDKFEEEKQQALSQDCLEGICECCPGSMYYQVGQDSNS